MKTKCFVLSTFLTFCACSTPLHSDLYDLASNKVAGTATYTVTYNGNGNAGGTIPTDPNNYHASATVTVADNTGNLSNPGYIFAGWNTLANGTGTNYTATNTFRIVTDVTLYAVWSASSDAGISVTDPIIVTVALSGQTATLTQGTDMTVTATPSTPVDAYAWYLDGSLVTGQTTGTLIDGSTLTIGPHGLMAVVTKNGILFSASCYFVVQ